MFVRFTVSSSNSLVLGDKNFAYLPCFIKFQGRTNSLLACGDSCYLFKTLSNSLGPFCLAFSGPKLFFFIQEGCSKTDANDIFLNIMMFYLKDANINHQCQPQIYTLGASKDIHLSSVSPGFQIRVCIGKLFSLFLIQNICCGYSKEPSQ